MEITEEQFSLVAPYLPRQRGNVRLDNRQDFNALLYVAENGCKWRALLDRFGPWHTGSTRMSRWSKAGVMDRMFARLQEERVMRGRLVH